MIEKHFEPFVLLLRTSTQDGMGGAKWSYITGKRFMAGAVKTASRHNDTPKDSTIVGCTIIHEPGIELHHDDIVQRVSDGRRFRVLSDSSNMKTPACAVEQYAQVSAEVANNA